MQQYLDMVQHVLDQGVWAENRTGTTTLSTFSYFYRVDLNKGYPLLTTKEVQWKSMLHELLWYLRGDHHIRDLQKHTKIWDAWADDKGNLQSAYGRFWRRFPVPGNNPLEGEAWPYIDSPEHVKRWVNYSAREGFTFDQISFVRDTLIDLHRDPAAANRRRLVVSAWHPGNAFVSTLPPCHYSFAFNIMGNKLNCHLTQRSGDVALGIPFNLACYALLTQIMAQETGYEVGEFAHTIVDCHIYEDHVEGLRKQLQRTPRDLPQMHIADKPMFELEAEDFHLEGYDPQSSIRFPVAV